MTGKEYNPLSIDEHWNSEYMKDIRRRMMAGEKISECEICQTQKLHIHTYKDYFTKHLFAHLLNDVEAHTKPDGSTDWRPRSFDYRFSNLCNFKCRMCGEQLSSAWENEKRQANLWRPEDQPWMVPEIRETIKKFTEDVVEKEFDLAIERGDVEEIYWVGGEPTIWPKHWETMEKITEKGDAGKVHIRYNTNLAVINWKGKHLFHDVLPPFKSYQVCASIDGAGKIGEWIRTGLEWDKWLEYFSSGLEYIPQRGFDSLVMDLTITLPGLFVLEELIKHARRMNVKMYVKIVYSFDSSVLLSPFALPKEVLHPILNQLILNLTPIVDEKTVDVVHTLKEMKNRKTFMEEYPNWKEGFKQGKRTLQDIAKIRGDGKNGRLSYEDILLADKEALRWWEGKYL